MKLDIKELKKVVRHYYEKKKALFVKGTFGIGKSVAIRDTAKEIAIQKKKAFREWNKLSKKEKNDLRNNPERYFVLIDERLSEWDASDIKGLPDFNGGEGDTIKWRIPEWAEFVTLKGSDGFIFFDEMNLACPLVISSVYKVIYDRVISDRAINDSWGILGAGNLESDRAFTHTLPSPVRDRGGEVELIPPDDDTWIEWAIKNDIDSKIIGFVKFSPDNLYSVDFDSNQKFTTHRGWERVSDLIEGVKDYDMLTLLTCSAIGEGIGRKFVSFCKIEESMNLEEVIKNPKKISEIKEVDVLYFLVTSVAERTRSDRENKIPFSKVMNISKELDKNKKAEFVALLWKMSSKYSDTFKEDFLNCNDKTIEKYSKYIL